DGVLDGEDFAVSQLWLPLGALVICLFVAWDFGWGWRRFREEASAGRGLALPDALRAYMTFVLPVLILAVLIWGLVAK
ncbi:MAG: sodium-dependent transporter, partial [Kiritimatiellae bacterium]|nr:sodium-dependent transporter [Kiritimatiellia bacterium]